MFPEIELGLLSLLPVLTAMVLAFWTKDAVVSLLAGCTVGVMLVGFDPATGLAKLFRQALATDSFVWVMLIEVAIGILIAFYMRTGVIETFASWASTKIRTRRSASGFGWLLGVCVFFSDYFGPLFSGPIARPLTDKHKVSREMLAYTLDSCSAPVCALVPLSGWAVYLSGLLIGYGPITNIEEGMTAFVQSIPYNFYAWITVILAGLISYQLIPNFGPMRRAEMRALKEGKVLRDGAVPLTGGELGSISVLESGHKSLFWYFFVPNGMVIAIAVGTFLVYRQTMILEAFFAAVIYMAIAMTLGKHFHGIQDAMSVAVNGVKAVTPAILILAAAYGMNVVSNSLGTPQYILSIAEPWMSPMLLPVCTFLVTATISFFTGTSWGTYAITTPLIMPLAMAFSGNTLSSDVLLTIGALTAGSVFGDHCSPISDTSSLSAFGASSDLMDHINTQMPYALVAALASILIYLALGMWI